MATAILVDGGFYRKRATAIWGAKTAEDRADELMEHIDGLSSHWRNPKFHLKKGA